MAGAGATGSSCGRIAGGYGSGGIRDQLAGSRLESSAACGELTGEQGTVQPCLGVSRSHTSAHFRHFHEPIRVAANRSNRSGRAAYSDCNANLPDCAKGGNSNAFRAQAFAAMVAERTHRISDGLAQTMSAVPQQSE